MKALSVVTSTKQTSQSCDSTDETRGWQTALDATFNARSATEPHAALALAN